MELLAYILNFFDCDTNITIVTDIVTKLIYFNTQKKASITAQSPNTLTREAKILAKRYKSFKADMKDFIKSLEKNPMQGDELSPGIRKIRLRHILSRETGAA
jgi:hypothetical protein